LIFDEEESDSSDSVEDNVSKKVKKEVAKLSPDSQLTAFNGDSYDVTADLDYQ
jgi:hypothetical protein